MRCQEDREGEQRDDEKHSTTEPSRCRKGRQKRHQRESYGSGAEQNRQRGIQPRRQRARRLNTSQKCGKYAP